MAQSTADFIRTYIGELVLTLASTQAVVSQLQERIARLEAEAAPKDTPASA